MKSIAKEKIPKRQVNLIFRTLPCLAHVAVKLPKLKIRNQSDNANQNPQRFPLYCRFVGVSSWCWIDWRFQILPKRFMVFKNFSSFLNSVLSLQFHSWNIQKTVHCTLYKNIYLFNKIKWFAFEINKTHSPFVVLIYLVIFLFLNNTGVIKKQIIN